MKIAIHFLRGQEKIKPPSKVVYYIFNIPEKIRKGRTSTAESKLRRLEKNRESARESRKRKKNYIMSLESKVETLESEISKLELLILTASHYTKPQGKGTLSYFSQLNSMD